VTGWNLDPQAFAALTPAEQEAVRNELRQLDENLNASPWDAFHPHPKQHDLLVSDKPMRCFFGGNRSGKTTVGIIDDLIQACDLASIPEHLRQYKRFGLDGRPFYCRILTTDFTGTMEGVIFQKIREWCPKDQLVGNSFERAYDKQTRILRFKNGSWFQFMTYEQDVDKLQGAALHRVHYDEEPPKAHRNECIMRLIDYAGEELCTMTPTAGMTWMYTDVYEPYQKGIGVDDTLIIEVDMDDNPHLDEKTKKRALAALPEAERRARKAGRFVHFAGMIYDSFARETHVEPDPEFIPSSSGVYVGIDPGARHAAAAVFMEVTHDDHYRIFDTLKLQGRTAKDMCEAIHMVNARWGIVPTMYVIDPAAANRIHQTGRSDQMEYADNGIITVLGQNSVTAGINRVKERLERKPPGLTIAASCTDLIDEFRAYRWKTPKKSEDDPKEAPVKKDDHLLDAMRYVIMSRPYTLAEDLKVDDRPLYVRLAEDDIKNAGARRTLSPGQGGGGFLA
jgi:phage terminase large subunit-like protein